MQNVRTGLNVITGVGGNIVVWSGEDGVVLVDTGLATASAAVVDAVSRISTAAGQVRHQHERSRGPRGWQ